MLQAIINFSIRNKLIILLGTIFLLAYGAYQVSKLPIDAVPDITDNQVQVITISPALGAPDVERFISFPIEQANSNLPGLKEIRSFSRFGLSVVTIVFHDDIDVYWARQQVAERLQQVKDEIPQGLGSPAMAPVTTGLGEIYQYVLRTKQGYENKYTPTDLRTFQDWIVRRQLLGVQGVADVSSFGGLLKQYQVVVNTDRLKSLHLTINDIFDALQNNNQNTGGAYIEKGPTVLFIRSEGLINKTEDIENIVITTNESAMPIKISDVARVEIGSANRYGALTYNDEGEVVGAVVMMLKGENSSSVIKNVKARVESIQKMLPEGVIIEPFLDRTKMVNNAISTVESNLIEGALIVIFILVLFLGNLRAGLVVASVIPLSMLFAIIMMNIFHVSGNLMSLGAIDFGLIIDGAVIIVEAVMHGLYHSSNHQTLVSQEETEEVDSENPIVHKTHISQSQMDGQVSQSAGKMMNVAIFGQIIILIVYLPIFTLQGIEGKMFKPMAQTVTFALLGAFLLSLTYVPVITSLLLSKKVKLAPSLSDKMMDFFENIYQRALKKVILFPKTILTVAVLLFCFSLYIMSNLGGEFIPQLEEGDFAVETRVLTGTNLPTTVEHTQKAVHLLLKTYPEIQKIVTKIGSGEIPTDPMPIEAADMMIILKDRKEWTSAKTFNELSEKMSKTLEDIPGVTFGFQYPVQMRFNELMTGAKQDIVCKIFGENLDTLSAKAHQLGELIPSIEGAKDLYVETVTGMPQILINYNRNMIAQYGLNIADINRAVNTAFAGGGAGLVFEGEKRFDLVVKLEKQQRTSLEDVQNLQISTPNGMQIPLSHLATVDIIEGPTQIQRENAQRRIIVGFNARGRDVQSIVEELQQKVASKLKLPSGYFIQYGGSFENLQAAKERLSIAVPVSLLLILLMLYFAFASVKQGLLIYTAIPLSTIGGVLALATRGMAFSISAGIGFIALFGVAVLNGIVLISEFNQLKAAGMSDLKEIILTGTKKRLRPVLMTAAVASLGFIPMALSQGAGGEVQRPLATVVIGGLFTATLLTLFVLPILYMLFSKTKKGSMLTVILLLILPFSAFSQQPINLSAAIDSAIQHHPSTALHQTALAANKALLPTAKNIEPTTFDFNLGQFNSLYIDYKMGANQSFAHPRTYQAKKELLLAENQSLAVKQQLSKQQIAAEVARLYIQLNSLQSKQYQLTKLDSVYTYILSLSKTRLEAGEDNILQYQQIEFEKENLQLQFVSLVTEEQNLLLRFQKLLGTKKSYAPIHVFKERYALMLPNPATRLTPDAAHPLLQYEATQIEIARQQTEVEKTKKLPSFNVGMNVQTLSGFQTYAGKERYFATYPRFFYLQGAINVPLYQKANDAAIMAAKLNEKKASENVELLHFQLEQAYQFHNQEVDKYGKLLTYYKEKLFPQRLKLLQTANQQYVGGELSFVEWLNILQQYNQLTLQYIETEQQYFKAQGELYYFMNYE